MKLTFHIGAGKTGSSAIQRALAFSKQHLADRGIHIAPVDLEPGGNVGGQQVFALQKIRDMDLDQARPMFARKLAALVADIESRGGKQLVFSGENLSNPFPWADVIAESTVDHEVEVILYIRRQDSYLLSAWQQWTLKQGIPLGKWLIGVVGITGDWRLPIEEWEKIASDGHMIVRLYERNRLVGGDVAQDFFAACGLPTDQLNQSIVVNHSYGIAAEELALSSSNVFKDAHDSGFFEFLDRYCQDAHLRQPGESRLSFDERQAILGRYRESNQWIRDRYFSGPGHEDLPATLFAPPRPDEGRMPGANEIADQKLAILTELLYGMYKESQSGDDQR